MRQRHVQLICSKYRPRPSSPRAPTQVPFSFQICFARLPCLPLPSARFDAPGDVYTFGSMEAKCFECVARRHSPFPGFRICTCHLARPSVGGYLADKRCRTYGAASVHVAPRRRSRRARRSSAGPRPAASDCRAVTPPPTCGPRPRAFWALAATSITRSAATRSVATAAGTIRCASTRPGGDGARRAPARTGVWRPGALTASAGSARRAESQLRRAQQALWPGGRTPSAASVVF